MIRKLLIANRGEIACRIARTCRLMGIGVATVHSEADRQARHVREIGESILIGPAPARQSYLNIEAILAAASAVGADAIHPGYGFLSENPHFARAVEAAGLIFVGPTSDTLALFGSKSRAKQLARQVGLPVVPGDDEGSEDRDTIFRTVERLGLPVLLKATAGGGGRGMRVIEQLTHLEEHLEAARREAANAFGSPELMVERYVPDPRHLEVQIAGDGAGQVLHLFERECSLQRRYQKIIEEAPAPHLDAVLRAHLLDDACRLARQVNYRGVGTVEFLVAGEAYYFLEVNARLQVEHPVTEAVTGLDLVRLQLQIAAGAGLGLRQEAIACRGHSIEARIYAEDARHDFLPASGRITHLSVPDGVRVELGIAAGEMVSSHYDAMIAKVIASGQTREAARERLVTALRHTVVAGAETNVDFLTTLLTTPEVQAGTYHTQFVSRLTTAAAAEVPGRLAAVAGAIWLHHTCQPQAFDPWRGAGPFLAWRLGVGGPQVSAVPAVILQQGGRRWEIGIGTTATDGRTPLVVDGQPVDLSLHPIDGDRWHVEVGDHVSTVRVAVAEESIHVVAPDGRATFDVRGFLALSAAPDPERGNLTAPMMGKILQVNVENGQQVKAGTTVAVLESMKMEMPLVAPYDGIITRVLCRPGDMVERGAVVAELQPASPETSAAS